MSMDLAVPQWCPPSPEEQKAFEDARRHQEQLDADCASDGHRWAGPEQVAQVQVRPMDSTQRIEPYTDDYVARLELARSAAEAVLPPLHYQRCTHCGRRRSLGEQVGRAS